MNELVRVTQTPQGTADVWIGDLWIKTFGGKVAHQAACDFAQQIRNEITKCLAVPVAGTSSVGTVTIDPTTYEDADAKIKEQHKSRFEDWNTRDKRDR